VPFARIGFNWVVIGMKIEYIEYRRYPNLAFMFVSVIGCPVFYKLNVDAFLPSAFFVGAFLGK
jgi:hypothetical protein